MSAAPAGQPPPYRWTPRRKATLLLLVDDGRISEAEAARAYAVSSAELAEWRVFMKQAGVYGLRSTRTQSYRSIR